MDQLAPNYWNFRGDFRIAGLVNLGTHMSLVRRPNGRFLLIDSYAVGEDDRDALMDLTQGGSAIDAILNVHPYHTLHCGFAHQLAPAAQLYGARRHREMAPDLPWESAPIEEASTQALFPDLEFSVPSGLYLVTGDDRVHAASVLVRDRESRIVHVDDTFNVLAAPGPLRQVLPQSRLRLHPMLGKALRDEAGAADAFEVWARDLAERWAGTPIVCAAHSAVRRLSTDGWRHEVLLALHDARHTLARHRRRHP